MFYTLLNSVIYKILNNLNNNVTSLFKTHYIDKSSKKLEKEVNTNLIILNFSNLFHRDIKYFSYVPKFSKLLVRASKNVIFTEDLDLNTVFVNRNMLNNKPLHYSTIKLKQLNTLQLRY
jgi:hypothetical protein